MSVIDPTFVFFLVENELSLLFVVTLRRGHSARVAVLGLVVVAVFATARTIANTLCRQSFELCTKILQTKDR